MYISKFDHCVPVCLVSLVWLVVAVICLDSFFVNGLNTELHKPNGRSIIFRFQNLVTVYLCALSPSSGLWSLLSALTVFLYVVQILSYTNQMADQLYFNFKTDHGLTGFS